MLSVIMKTTLAVNKSDQKILATKSKRQAPKSVNSKIVIGELEGKLIENAGCWDSDFN